MKAADRRRMAVNLRKWNESVPLHFASETYDVPSFLKGTSTLEPLELVELGPVRGCTLLHLQCHFGLDTLSWARLGARVTGIDYSGTAVQQALRLARSVGIEARFLRSNLYSLPKVLEGTFDVVYTGKGAYCWLPDLDRWARIVARYLRPGGRFFLLEDHPVAELFSNENSSTRLELTGTYFGERPVREVYDGTYATNAKMRNRVSYLWTHPVYRTLTALLDAGLVLESFREYPYSYWRRFRLMTEDREGYWHLKGEDGRIPLMWSVRARKPAQGEKPPRMRGARHSPRSPEASRR